MSEKVRTHRIDDLGRLLISGDVREAMGWELQDVISVQPNPEDGTVTLRLVEAS